MKATTSMKYQLLGLAAAFLLGPLYVQAQNLNVVNAYNAMNNGDLDEAAAYIEPAIENDKTAMKEKTWRYRGQIYSEIARGRDEALKAKYPNALQIAVDSYVKAMKLDKRDSWKRENQLALGELQVASMNAAIKAFEDKEYDQAIAGFLMGEDIAKKLGVVDTNAVYNSALAYEAKGDTSMAIQRYQECIDLGYNAPSIYRYLANIQRQAGHLDQAIATTRAGLKAHPGNKEMMLDEVAFLLEADRMEEAESSVKQALVADPDNPVLYAVLGSLYDSKANPKEGEVEEAEMLKWYDKAEEAYKNSIEADPEFFDGYYNIGVLYNNRAAYEYAKCNQLDSDAAYEKCTKQADKIYLKTIPYFERAHEIRPDDRNTMQQLKILYAKTQDTEKYDAIKQELGE